MFLNRVILSTLKAFNSKTGSRREEHLVTLMLCRSFGTYFPKHWLKEPFLYCTLSHKAGEGSHGYHGILTARIALYHFSTFLHFSYFKWPSDCSWKKMVRKSGRGQGVFIHTLVQLFFAYMCTRTMIWLMAINVF